MPTVVFPLAAVVVIALLLWVGLVGVLWLHRPLRDLAGPALRLPPDILRLSGALLADPATPRGVKFALGALVAYLISPLDLVPDFLPVIGSLDDVIMAGLVLRWVGRRIGRASLEAHWSGTPQGLAWLLRLV
jgi:uncharacterized membrane protein YkvA (DUF1232 family)